MGTRDKVTNFTRKDDMVIEVLKFKYTPVQTAATNYSNTKECLRYFMLPSTSGPSCRKPDLKDDGTTSLLNMGNRLPTDRAQHRRLESSTEFLQSDTTSQ
jgi:hypothetical protein